MHKVAVDKGALEMVSNIMRRCQKNEAIDALLETATDIEDVLAWYAKHRPELYMSKVTGEMIRNHT